MQTPILYHYAMSPYSEKLRLALSATTQEWGSVVVPARPPRRALDVLLGGYRRIPVLQMGAHFYCDSRLAFDALHDARVSASRLNAEDEALRQMAEQDIFFSVIAAAPQFRVFKYLRGQLGLAGTISFVCDRMQMMRSATVMAPKRHLAAEKIAQYVLHLGRQLVKEPYLSGASLGYLDLCCYHPLWMAAKIDRTLMLHWPKEVCEWMLRLDQMPRGVSRSYSLEAVTEAVENDQAEIAGEVSSLYRYGDSVALNPVDYARDKTEGELIALDTERVVIRRQISSSMRVYLHFPVRGFDLVKC
jgi:glutathione S-transferase